MPETLTITPIASDLPLERLESEITQMAGNIAAATAQLLEWIAVYDRREGWKSWGCQSAAHWLSWKCGDDLHTAREKVRVARALDSLPSLAAAFRGGEVTYSKVRAVTRVAGPEDDAEWVGIAKESTGAYLERIVSAVRSSLDRDEHTDVRQAFERRAASISAHSGELVEIKISGPRDSIDTIYAVADVIASQIIDDSVGGSGRRRRDVVAERGGLAAVRFDALVQMAERILAANPAAAERGDIGRLNLVVDTEAVEAISGAQPKRCPSAQIDSGETTLGGRHITSEVLKRWACDIRASVVLEQSGHVHDEGQQTRTPNRRLRRALHRRDRGMCRFPGCAATSWLHAHHIWHWTEGGPTDLDNLVSLCGFHHHLVHEGGWTVELIEQAIAWTDPAGQPATIEPLSGSIDRIHDRSASRTTRTTSLESRWHNDRLDFAFVVSVLAEHCQRLRRKSHVPAETPRCRGNDSDEA